MKHRPVLLPILLLSIPATLAVGQEVTRDSVRVTRGEPVVVEAERRVVVPATSTQPLTLLEGEELRSLGATDLGEALELATGLFVRRYGGRGSLQTISVRGTASSQTTILVDGLRLRGSATPGGDLSRLRLEEVERIEVLRGGSGSVHGANSVGGVVNVVTRRPAGEGGSGQLRLGLGSYGEREITGRFSFGDGRTTLDASGGVVANDGNYPFELSEFGQEREIRRENGDLGRVDAALALTTEGEKGESLRLGVEAFHQGQGAPGSVVQGRHELSRARLFERELALRGAGSLAGGGWSLDASAGLRMNTLRYRDPDDRSSGERGTDDRWDRTELLTTISARRPVGTEVLLELRAESSVERLDGRNLDPASGDRVERLGLGLGTLLSWSGVEMITGGELGLDAAIRADLFSGLAPSLTPSLALLWRPADLPLRLRGRVGAGFRTPSFLEQYYRNYGTTDLRPERSLTVDLGFTWTPLPLLLVEGSIYRIETRDQIVAVPKSPVRWSAANLEAARSEGIELTVVGDLIARHVSVRAGWSLSDVRDRTAGPTYGDRLPYAPAELLSIALIGRSGALTITLDGQRTSHRFGGYGEDPTTLLPSFTLVGASCAYRLEGDDLDASLRLALENALGLSYQVIRGYPLPGRQIRAEVTLHLGG